MRGLIITLLTAAYFGLAFASYSQVEANGVAVDPTTTASIR